MFYVAFSSVIFESPPWHLLDHLSGFLRRIGSLRDTRKNYKADHNDIITAAVLWSGDCRYGVSHELLNRSIIFERIYALDI